MLRIFFVFIFLISQLAIAVFSQEVQWSPEQVYYGSGGKLEYAPDEKGNIIPDFSHVGYMYGDVEIPDIPVVVEVGPIEGDDGASIQSAINQVAAMSPDENGFRGTVLLKKGTYQVSGQLFIKSSGVVLRGEGQTDQGTVLIATGSVKRDFIVIGNGRGFVNQSGKVDIIEEYVPLGRKYVIVKDASDFQTGDQIALYRPGTQNWISDLKMDQIPDPDGSTNQWKPSSYSFYFERLVTKVKGDTIYFRNPVVMAMDQKYGGGSVVKSRSDRISKVGVEDICFKSTYKSNSDENHAWIAIAFNAIEHGWAGRVTSWHFGYGCVSIKGTARLITIEDSHCRDPKSQISGGRRYSFSVSGSLNLIKGCSADEGRHDFVTGSRVRGPNVFTRGTVTNAHADTGPHHRWAMGTLYDCIVSDGAINVQDRGSSGSGHGWAGANQVFWNCTGASSICQSPYVSAKNYNFGFMGKKDIGRHPRPDGIWVGNNRPGIFPESLYQTQLNSRLNDDGVFSVYPKLEKANDSSFVISFNMPFQKKNLNTTNFSTLGNAGFEGAEFSIDVLSDTSVMLTFDAIGPLPSFSSVVVAVTNIFDTSGNELKGLTSATYIEPDLRPVVKGVSTKVNNEDGILEASSSKPGFIYLVKFNEEDYHLENYKSLTGLEQAVAENIGRKVNVTTENIIVYISTAELPGGFYIFYAVDKDGRISEPGKEWPQVEETVQVTGTGNKMNNNPYKIWSANKNIFIQPDDISANYSVDIFDIAGRRIDLRKNMSGNQQFIIPDYQGLLIVKLISEKRWGIKTHKLLHKEL